MSVYVQEEEEGMSRNLSDCAIHSGHDRRARLERKLQREYFRKISHWNKYIFICNVSLNAIRFMLMVIWVQAEGAKNVIIKTGNRMTLVS